jgi:hypothetical protein
VNWGKQKKISTFTCFNYNYRLVISRKILLFSVIIAFAACSCRSGGVKAISQGEIHYDVAYSGNITLMPRELMPKNLVVSFKNDNILYELISPFGNSGITNLSNPSKSIYDTYLSMFTIRYFYPSQPGEVYPGFEAMDGIEIHKTAKSAVICGFKCKNAEVTFPFDRTKIYNVWYTNEIHVKDPNASTPFNQIDGVLMSFFFFIGHSELHFVAENVYRKQIPDYMFERKEKFHRVSRKDIDKFINKMVSL